MNVFIWIKASAKWQNVNVFIYRSIICHTSLVSFVFCQREQVLQRYANTYVDFLVIIVPEIKNKQLLGIKYALQVCKR